MKEINRYPIENSDAVLIHMEDAGERFIWIAMDPPPSWFDPAVESECFIVASGDDGFAGLEELKEALSRCAAGCRE